ncbi:ribonuclease domain-containing protein [Streptomyces sp. NK15101]|uniref:ribonuclease domain-containing protein n=1 Tax=Streptomyces sp. NK15101 TaxID=2873261 RepID=UPI001CECF3CF|nr:ribonuclease domain-containing protein [Streptomyces sp. NK15101]
MSLRPLRVLLALVLAVLLAGCSSAGGGAAPAAPARTAPVAASTGTSGLPAVRVSELPPEARNTLALIARGGPFPYARDGAVFSNFERLLPRRERGYYHEYTVRTPGEHDRGARRIVTGRSGERYYTDDHYETFREVVADEDR